jgi:ligand-binding sensor domain-containing protein
MKVFAKLRRFQSGPKVGRGRGRLACLILSIVVIVLPTLHAQTNGRSSSLEQILSFDRYSVDQGLSQSLVRCIWQDRQGFLWFGTEDGLNKYDGYSFKHFKHDPENPNSLSHNFILTIYEDRAGMLWIGTWGGGLNRFDPATEQFTRYRHDPDDPQGLSDNDVLAIHEDQFGALWVGTNGGGLNRYDPETEQFIHYRHDPNQPYSLSHDRVNEICEDQTGALWLGTNNGLDKLVPPKLNSSESKNDGRPPAFVHFRHNPNNPKSLSKGPVSSVHLDYKGVLWIGVFGGGLDRLVAETGEFVHYRHDPNDPHSLSDNSVWTIYEDKTGTLWIGTFYRGLNRFDRETEQFICSQHQPHDDHSLSHNMVLAIHADRAGALWVGTFSELNRSRMDKSHFSIIAIIPTIPTV